METLLPIIRFEIQGMKQSLTIALTKYALQLDADIKKAVEAYCTPENLERVIQQEVNRALDEVISEEVRNFYLYGAGREQISDAVKEKLLPTRKRKQ